MNEEERYPSISDGGIPTSGDSTAHGITIGETGGDDQRDFRFLAENARDAIAVVSRSGDFLYVNRRAYELTEYTDADRAKTTLIDLVPHEEMNRVFALRAARHSGQSVPERYETSILTRSGRTVPVEITAAETTWQGQPADVVILRDISERKRAEEALRRRDAVLETINFATECFLSSPAWEERITDVLERVGRAMVVCRVFLWEFQETPEGEIVASRRCSWIHPEQQQSDEQIGESFPMRSVGLSPWIEKYERGQVVQNPVREFPDAIRKSLEEAGLRAVLTVPIQVEHQLWGILGLGDCEIDRRWSDLEMEAIQTAGRILGALIRRQQVEDALRTSEAKYRSLVEAPKLSIVTLDRDGTFHFANSNAAANLGLPATEIVGKTIWDFFPKEYADKHIVPLRDALDSKQVAVYEAQTVIQGRETWREVRVQPLIETDGSCDKVLTIANDISERKEIERKILSYQKRLRSLTSDLLLTEERERRRIAGELHDRIGQALAISKMKLGALLREAAAGPDKLALKEVRTLIDQTIKDTRSLTFDLSPPILHELGLEPAVEWLVDRLKDEHGIDATFQDDGEFLQLGDNCRILLFQSVQELLMNVMRHAQAQRVEVSIRHDGDEIEIETKDNGIGFDATQISLADGGPTGYGLFSIRERLCHLGGQLEIKSKPGHGSRIILRVPRLVDTGQHGEEHGEEPR